MTVAPFVLHYLRRLVKRPGLVLFLTAVPVSLALVEFWAFGPSAGGKPGGAAGAVPVVFVDLDHGVSSRWLASCTTDGFGKEALSVSAIDQMSTARAEFDSGTYAAMIVAPVGFQPVSGGPAVTIQLRSKEDLAGRVAAEVLGACVELASRRDTLKADASIGTTKVEVDRPASAPDSGPEFFTSIFPGLMLFGLMIVSQSMAGLLLRDRASAVDRRLLTLPISNTGVFAGAMLYLAAGLGLLMVFHGMLGATALHVKVEGVPALLAIGFGFVVFISALQLVVGAISPTVRGAQATSAIAVMLLSLLGGAFVPASGYPPALRKVVEMLPNGAAQVGMLRMLGHPGWTNGLSELLVVWSWAIVLSALAFVLYRRRSARS